MAQNVIIVTAVAVILIGSLGFILYREFSLLRERFRAGITQPQFDALPEGAPEAEVWTVLPAPLSGITGQDLYGNDPGKLGMPAGATCAYYPVRPFESGSPRLWRFCFCGRRPGGERSVTIPE